VVCRRTGFLPAAKPCQAIGTESAH
jgi:hypothetical protein